MNRVPSDSLFTLHFWRTHGVHTLGLGVVAVLLLLQLRQGLADVGPVFRMPRRGGHEQGNETSGGARRGKARSGARVHRSNSGDFDYSVEEDGGTSLGVLSTVVEKSAVGRGGFPRAQTQLGLEQPLVIAMVGLPARGKSYLVKMLMRYLRWTGYECEVFNVGSLRRAKGMAGVDVSFFDTTNQNAKQLRENLATEVQDVMYEWISEAGSDGNPRIAIFDATNTTRERRLKVATRARERKAGLLFVESICNDEQVLQKNYEMKLQNDDYKDMDPAVARKDFQERVAAYERVYETIKDDEVDGQISYIQLINVGQKVITRNCSGYISSQISFYLQQVHIGPRKIYLTLTGESTEEAMQGQKLGKDSLLAGESAPLSKAGNDYAEKLGKFLETVMDKTPTDLLILSGTQNVHAETILHLRPNFKCYSTPLLNELRGGDLHGLSSAQIVSRFPEEHTKRERDRLSYRFPGFGGESYLDVIERAKPVIIELERQRRSIVVCAHIAVIRCAFAPAISLSVKQGAPPYPYLPRSLTPSLSHSLTPSLPIFFQPGSYMRISWAAAPSRYLTCPLSTTMSTR